MEIVRGIMTAFVEFIEKIAGDNEALKNVMETIKQIFSTLTNDQKEPAAE